MHCTLVSLCGARPRTATGDTDPINIVCDVSHDVVAHRRTARNWNAVAYSNSMNEAGCDNI